MVQTNDLYPNIFNHIVKRDNSSLGESKSKYSPNFGASGNSQIQKIILTTSYI